MIKVLQDLNENRNKTIFKKELQLAYSGYFV